MLQNPTAHFFSALRGLQGLVMGLCVLFSLAVFAPATARAQLAIDITKGNLDPTQIAIPNFIAADPSLKQAGEDVAQVIRDNLERSGLFKSLDPASFIETQTDINYQPTFADWRVIKAEALVSGRIVRMNDGKLRVEFRLWDIYGGKQLDGLRFSTTPDNWRRIAHKVSDAIYKRLTGETGYFDTRVVYISESGPKTDRKKRLAIMDQDGANPQFLLTGASLVLTPRFDPSSQKITYLSYETGQPQVYQLEIETGRREILGRFPGMTFAPRYSPDGTKIVMSLSKDGNSEIYVRNLKTGSTSRLTNDSGIDVSPSFSPDGRKIVFNSDRSGSPQLYVMNADGSGVKRLTFGKGRYNTPVWSPRGDLIAFTKSGGGRFSIGVMNASDGKNERLLTNGFLVEGPTWAPNGRVILFSKEVRGRGSEIWSVDLTGANLRKLNISGDASDPAWSPLLP